MATVTTTCGTCETVRVTEGQADGFTEVYVYMCRACVAQTAPAADIHDATPSAEDVQLFEALLDAEFVVRGEMTSRMFGDIETRERARTNLKAAQAELDRQIEALTLDQLTAYGPYRAAVKRRNIR